MKDYKEVAKTVLAERDSYLLKRSGFVKRMTAFISVFFVCVIVGGGALMVGLNRKDAPNKPPKVTNGIGDMTRDTVSTNTTDKDNITDTDTEGNSDNTVESDTESEPVSESETESVTQTHTPEPTEEPTEVQTPEPTEEPTEVQTPEPTEEPTTVPTEAPTTQTEPVTTEPKPIEPPEITPDPTEGLLQVGKLEAKDYYTGNSPTYNPPSGDGYGFESWEDPILYYKPGFERYNGNPIEYTIFADDYYFINADNYPTRLKNYSVSGKYWEDERPCVERLTESYFGAENAQAVDLLLSEDYIPEVDEYGTRFRIGRSVVRIRDGVETYETAAYATLTKTEAHMRCDFTYDEIYEYVISLPHFRAMLAYADIGEYTVERIYKRYSNDHYCYEFVFIPKTDDALTAMLYRKSRSVTVSGQILPHEAEQNNSADILFIATDVPYTEGKSYSIKDFDTAFEITAKNFEKFGMREYFVKNYVCFMDKNGTKFWFYLKFVNENGEVVYCNIWKYGFRTGDKPGAEGPIGIVSMLALM